MSSTVRIIIGGILVLVGLVWMLQGLGVLGGSAMSGVTVWAIVGPLVAIGGAALALSGRRRRT